MAICLKASFWPSAGYCVRRQQEDPSYQITARGLERVMTVIISSSTWDVTVCAKNCLTEESACMETSASARIQALFHFHMG